LAQVLAVYPVLTLALLVLAALPAVDLVASQMVAQAAYRLMDLAAHLLEMLLVAYHPVDPAGLPVVDSLLDHQAAFDSSFGTLNLLVRLTHKA
jgi:hypothetical protein